MRKIKLDEEHRFTYYADEITGTMYIWAYRDQMGGLTAMFNPETGLPLTLDEFKEYEAKYLAQKESGEEKETSKEKIHFKVNKNQNTPEIRNAMSVGNQYIEQISCLCDKLIDVELKENVIGIKNIAEKIMEKLKCNNDLVMHAKIIFNEYFPDTIDYLTFFVDAENSDRKTQKVERTKQKIKDSIQNIKNKYQDILDKIFDVEAEAMFESLKNYSFEGDEF